MKTVLRFIRPYKWLCFFTLIVMFLDVAGGLLIPTITADMINAGINGGNMDYLIRSGNTYADCNNRYQFRGTAGGVILPQTFPLKSVGICGTLFMINRLPFPLMTLNSLEPAL